MTENDGYRDRGPVKEMDVPILTLANLSSKISCVEDASHALEKTIHEICKHLGVNAGRSIPCDDSQTSTTEEPVIERYHRRLEVAEGHLVAIRESLEIIRAAIG